MRTYSSVEERRDVNKMYVFCALEELIYVVEQSQFTGFFYRLNSSLDNVYVAMGDLKNILKRYVHQQHSMN